MGDEWWLKGWVVDSKWWVVRWVGEGVAVD